MFLHRPSIGPWGFEIFHHRWTLKLILLDGRDMCCPFDRSLSKQKAAMRGISSDNLYEYNGFGKCTPPPNRRLILKETDS